MYQDQMTSFHAPYVCTWGLGHPGKGLAALWNPTTRALLPCNNSSWAPYASLGQTPRQGHVTLHALETGKLLGHFFRAQAEIMEINSAA